MTLRSFGKLCRWAAFGLSIVAILALPGRAGTFQVFDLTYSGAFLGNSASATGQIVIDLDILPNPGTSSDLSWVQSLFLTVSGATSGNGTFILSDFAESDWDTNGATLDPTQDLVGQPTAGSPWGTTYDGNSGDFNLFNASTNAPSGVLPFILATDGGNGNPMVLASFAPDDAAAPEPGTPVLLVFAGASLLGLSAWRRRSNRF